MKKFIVIMLLLVFIILAIAYHFWNKRAELLSQYMSKSMGTKVTLNSVEFPDSKVILEKFHVQNPLGSKLPTAFFAKGIDISYTFRDVITDPHIIDEVIIKDVEISIEKYRQDDDITNWSKIFGKFDTKKESDEKKQPSSNERNVIIKHLSLRNIEVTTFRPIIGKAKIKIPLIDLYNVGENATISPQEVIHIIFSFTLQYILALPEVGKILKEVLKLPEEILKIPVNFLKNILSEDQTSARLKANDTFSGLQQKLIKTGDIISNEGEKLQEKFEVLNNFLGTIIDNTEVLEVAEISVPETHDDSKILPDLTREGIALTNHSESFSEDPEGLY